ncbi:trichohyalin-like [Colossoma macropomum]|uniref:trichohyalin-like n=1 Tax=Colossoma macropomum TaxID=42526 RepID=UPI001864B179|nr:trichohyalin-like [Colossoma macropomum]
MVQWRLQIVMERERVEKEERQELQRLRELEKELQLKELREREKERKERERQPSTRKVGLMISFITVLVIRDSLVFSERFCALRGSGREGETRGMEEIVREQEMQLLRCRERRNQLKREVKRMKEKIAEEERNHPDAEGERLLLLKEREMEEKKEKEEKMKEMKRQLEAREKDEKRKRRECKAVELEFTSNLRDKEKIEEEEGEKEMEREMKEREKEMEKKREEEKETKGQGDATCRYSLGEEDKDGGDMERTTEGKEEKQSDMGSLFEEVWRTAVNREEEREQVLDMEKQREMEKEEPEKQREEEGRQKESSERELEIERIMEARRQHMEREMKRKRELMKKLFSPGVNMFRTENRVQRRKQRNLKEPSINEEEQAQLEGQEEPQRSSWPVSPNGEPLVISIKPSNPVLEEPEPCEPSPTDPPTDPHTEDTVGGDESSVVEEAVLKPEGFTEPQSEEALNEAMEQASPTQTDHPKDGPTSSETVEEADHDAGTGKQAENKNQRMRIIGWINQKVKERHQKSIQKSFMKEMNYGYRLLKTSEGVMTLAKYEQAKREKLRKKEERRQALEDRWREWEEKRAEKKARKEEEKQALEAKRREEEKKEAEKKAEKKAKEE